METQPYVPTPEDIEAAQKKLDENPDMKAALYLQTAIPKLRALINNNKFTGTQAKAVLEMLMVSPLEDTSHLKLNTQAAVNVFNACLNITNSKFILFTSGLKENEKGLDKQEEQKNVSMSEVQENNAS